LLGNQFSGNTTTYTTHKWKFVSWVREGVFRDSDYISGDLYIPINSIFQLGAYVTVSWYNGTTWRFKFDIADRVGVNYNINYNGNDSDGGSTGSNTATYGSNYTFQANGFTKTGYTFYKWALNSNGNFIGYYNAEQLYGIWTLTSSNVIVYATWTAKTYTITYDANGGSGTLATNPQTATYDSTFTFSANTFAKIGHEFSGWHLYDGITRINQTSTYGPASYLYGTWNQDKNLTAKAQWTPKEYTITYDGNISSGSMPPSTTTYGSPFTFSANTFAKQGYEFSGWHLYDGITRINQTSTYGPASYLYGTWNQDKNLTAIAQWTPNVFTVTFNANGKGGTNGTGGTKIIAQNYNTIVTCPIFKAVGHVFGGWATSATSTIVNKIGGATFTLGNADQTFFAIWTVNTDGTKFSELQTVFSGENPIHISEYRSVSGQTTANSTISVGTHLRGKSPPIT
jgi:hypothetical protein